MQIFLSDWLSEMESLPQTGVAWRRPSDGEMVHTAVSVTAAVSTDARSELQNTAKTSCPYCEIDAEKLESGKLVYRYQHGWNAEQRTHHRMTVQALDVTTHMLDLLLAGNHPVAKCHCVGVQGKSCLSKLPNFDIAHSFTPDFGRLLLQVGVELLLHPRSEGHCLADLKWRTRMVVNTELNAALVPPFAQKPNVFENVESWSCGQMLDWILLYSLPVLKNRREKTQLQHWACLVKAVHLLSLPAITEDDLDTAQNCINTFMLYLLKFYPEDVETLPVHLLTHLVEATRQLGPLWVTASNRFLETHQIIKVSFGLFP